MKTISQFIIRTPKTILLLLLAVLVISSCKKSKDADPDIVGLNVVNALPGSAGVNFMLNGALVSGPVLTYGQSSGYFSAYAGSTKFDFTTSGTTTSIANTNVQFTKDGYYTVFLVGSSTSPSIFLTEDDPSAPPSNKAKIRFINASPDAPSLNLSTSTGTLLASNVSYKIASDYVNVDPANFTFQIKNTTGGNTLVSLDKAIQSGLTYNIMVAGLVAGQGTTGLSLQVFTGF